MALSFRTKFGYGMGHVLNDLVSALWFTYLLIYLHHVVGFPNVLAGVILLIGQIADGFSTVFIGLEADRTDDLLVCAKYGRRKTWHLIGTIMLLCTYAFIFVGCIGCEDASYNAQIVYYAPFVMIFQFGWAAAQISHLALLPSLSSDQHDRTELNAIRYAFTVISTIAVYIITWLVFGLAASNSEGGLGPSSQPQFVKIVFSILVLGIFSTVAFHICVKEDNSPVTSIISISQSHEYNLMVWHDWFKEPQLYLVAMMYMTTRLFCNLTQAYIPLYLQDTLNLNKESIAYIPLVMYLSGLVTTFAMKPINKLAGRKITFLLGCLVGLAGCIWIYFDDDLLFVDYYLYVVAALLGSGSSTMLVTSLSITADFIGQNVECGAFVYGVMSFTDKMSNGIAVMVIQTLTPCVICSQGGFAFFRYVITFACGGTALFGVFCIILLFPFEIGKRKYPKLLIPVAYERSLSNSSDDSNKASYTYAPLLENDDDDDIVLSTNAQVRTVS